jgi:hypothetical protein
MSQSHELSIREILLAEIRNAEIAARNPTGPTMQQGSVLNAVAAELKKQRPGAPQWQQLTPELEEALLTQWNELFRTGLLAWGYNLSNPNAPFFHLTQRGRQALANASRDPSNPAGYLRHLGGKAPLNDVARSYLTEGLDCYVGGLFKAGAVMVGSASESLILELADVTQKKLTSLAKPIPKALNDWRVKTVADGMQALLEGQKGSFAKEMRESFGAYWPAFIQQIRATRNDAGHPTSVDPVTPDTLHASLLIFPELAQLVHDLNEWVTKHLA